MEILTFKQWHFLAELPLRYHDTAPLLDANSNVLGGGGGGAPKTDGSDKSGPGSGKKVENTRKVATLIARWDKSGCKKMRELFDMAKKLDEDKRPKLPKCARGDVCMCWALRGFCFSNCKRLESHMEYPSNVNRDIHDYCDKVGFAKAE